MSRARRVSSNAKTSSGVSAVATFQLSVDAVTVALAPALKRDAKETRNVLVADRIVAAAPLDAVGDSADSLAVEEEGALFGANDEA